MTLITFTVPGAAAPQGEPGLTPYRVDLFWAKVGKGEGCWEWTAAKTDHGYGAFWTGHRVVMAHRIAWELENGPIPPGLFVCHRCDNPPCCNHGHLFLGTNAENMADCCAKERQNRGERNGGAKLGESEVREIRRLTAAGFPHEAVATKFGVRRQAVGKIVNGDRWGWLT